MESVTSRKFPNIPDGLARVVFFGGGVVLPLLAVAFEMTTHFCARLFFDPFPSISHALLFLLIPLSNFFAWFSMRRDVSNFYASMALASGMAAGIATMYSLMFLPVVGLSLLFVFAGGFGLLGLSPMIALPLTMRSGRVICKLAESKGVFVDTHQLKHIGHLIILIMVIAVELPSTLTRINLARANSPKEQIDGIRWLRKYGNQEVMLRACYERSGRATDILGSLYESAHPLPIDDARRIYFRVTGKPFNSVALPPSARATIRRSAQPLVSDISGVNATVEDEFDLDADIAGEIVSGVARGLSISQGSINGTIDPDALLGKFDWSVTLTNGSKYDREARAKVLLPRGAVVTDAFLTLDGREHKADILVRKQARIKYVQSVSKRRKDPLLVSTCGPDEVLFQCFPVRPEQFAAVRLSYVCPLVMCKNDHAVVGLPTIVEKNFQHESPMQVTIQSSGAVSSTCCDLKNDTANHLVGSVSTSNIDQLNVFIRGQRNSKCHEVFCRNIFDGQKSLIERTLRREQFPTPQRLFIVVDASAPMRAHMPEITKGLQALPSGLPVELVVVGDQSVTLCNAEEAASPGNLRAGLQALDKFECIAGQDDSVSLLSAVDRAASTDDAAVLWIHGSQPVHQASQAELKKPFSSRKQRRPLLYDFRVESGPNAILQGMTAVGALVEVPRGDGITKDLENLFYAWTVETELNAAPEFRTVELNTGTAMVNDAAGNDKGNGAIVPAVQIEADPALAQLYAYRQVQENFDSSNTTEVARASDLAEKYHLVSPVSSALVSLDDPNEEQRVSTAVAPEADTWLLLIVAFAVIAWFIHTQKLTRLRPRVTRA